MSQHAVQKISGKKPWIVRGLKTGRILGRHKTQAQADTQLRAVEWRMHGGKPRRRPHDVSHHRLFKLR